MREKTQIIIAVVLALVCLSVIIILIKNNYSDDSSSNHLIGQTIWIIRSTTKLSEIETIITTVIESTATTETETVMKSTEEMDETS